MKTGQVILCRDSFPLRKGLSFASFIYELDQKSFSPFVLTNEPTDSFNEYELEFSYSFVPLLDKPLLAETRSLDFFNLQYSEDTNEVLMRASISTGWLLFHILCWGALFLLTLIAAIASRQLSVLAISLMWLVPFWILYNRGRQRCRRVRLIATKPS